MTIIEALEDANLFGRLFKDIQTWKSWIVFLKAVFALPMDREEVRLFKRCTNGRRPLKHEVRETYVIAGRRAGKSFVTAIVAVFLAIFRSYTEYLSAGEPGVVMIISRDRSQARIILSYIRAILIEVPLFAAMILNEKAEEIELTNGITIAIHTCSFRAVRGYTIVAAILEEMAFWRVEGVNPDNEILKAIRPAMTTIPNAKLLAISSPYSRTGVLYDMYRDYYGRDDDEILVWQADSMTMNPTLSKKSIENAYERDPEASASEYGAEFRSDLETFLKAEAVDACVITDRLELPPLSDYAYTGFVDPSGGGSDAFTLAIGHEEERGGLKVKVLDLVRRMMPPFDPQTVVKKYCEILKQYQICEVVGDRYAAQWVVSAFKDNGIKYTHCEKIKSQLYLELEPMINCREVELLDDKTLIKELKQLERHTGRQRADIVDHPPRLKDDVANAVAGVMHGINTWVEPRIYLI